MRRRNTYLLCHAGGLCKQVWDPVVTRLRDTLDACGTNGGDRMVTFDFPFHGIEGARQGSSKRWDRWATAKVADVLKTLKGGSSSCIGIGHSMGAAALLRAEVANPGSFKKLILFEPVINATHMQFEEDEEFPDAPMVKRTKNRVACWDSGASLRQYLSERRPFNLWADESIEKFIAGGVQQNSDGTCELRCKPEDEANLYSVNISMAPELLSGISCPIHIVYGGDSNHFDTPWGTTDDFFEALHKAIPGSTLSRMEGLTHFMVMEDPQKIADMTLRLLSSNTDDSKL